MKIKDIKIGDIFKLDEYLKMEIIKLVPIDLYLELLKNNDEEYKLYKEELEVDSISKITFEKISNIFLDKFINGDIYVMNLVLKHVKKFIELITIELDKVSINLDTIQNIKRHEELEKIFSIFETNIKYDKKVNYIKLYAELMGLELSENIVYKFIEFELKLELNKNSTDKLNLETEYEKLLIKYNEMEFKLDEVIKSKVTQEEKLNCKIDELKMQLNSINDENIELTKKVKIETDDLYEKVKSEWIRDNNENTLEILKKQEEICLLKDKQKKIEEHVDKFIENIDVELIDSMLKKSIIKKFNDELFSDNKSNIDLNLKEVESSLYCIKGQLLDKTSQDILQVEDFFYDVEDNLCKHGIISENLSGDKEGFNNYNFAIYLYNIIKSNRFVLLIAGFGTRELALSISMAYSSEEPDIIVMPNGYNNLNEIIIKIKESRSHVLLIENYQGGMNDILVKNIINANLEKIILFAIEDISELKYIPKYMFNYFKLVNIDIDNKLTNDYKKDEFKCVHGREFLMSNEIMDDYKIDTKYEDLIENLDLSNMSKSILINIIEDIISSKALSSLGENINLEIENIIGSYLLEEYLKIESDIEILDEIYTRIMNIQSNSEKLLLVMDKINHRMKNYEHC